MVSTRCAAACALTGLLAGLAIIGGCARGEENAAGNIPDAVLDVYVRFAGPIDDSAYYFVALDVDGDFGDDYPVPIANGPFWGNGWGTGSITHFLEYHLGRYELYRANLAPVLRETAGSITAVAGTPTGGDAGRYEVTIGALTFGSVSVTGAGMVTSANNAGGQNAGTIALSTNAAGETVAGSVSFTPAADGGKTPSVAQQAQIDALNAGGVALQAGSLSAFGITLALGAAVAGTQSLEIAPTLAAVSARFVPASAGVAFTRAATITANSSIPTASPPIPGAIITTGELTTGHLARIDVEISQQPVLIGPPFSYTVPSGGSTLRAQIDLADLGTNLTDISLNVISTTELIFDPNVTDPDLNCFDGLGRLGNDAITFNAREFRVYTNATAFMPEGADDATLRSPATPDRQRAVDITDWQVEVKRLR